MKKSSCFASLKVMKRHSVYTLTNIDKPETYFFTTLYRQIYRYYKKLALDNKLRQLIAESPHFQNITDETVLAQESKRLIARILM